MKRSAGWPSAGPKSKSNTRTGHCVTDTLHRRGKFRREACFFLKVPPQFRQIKKAERIRWGVAVNHVPIVGQRHMLVGTMSMRTVVPRTAPALLWLEVNLRQGSQMASQLELSARAELCKQLAKREPTNRVLWMAEAENWSRLSNEKLRGEPAVTVFLLMNATARHRQS